MLRRILLWLVVLIIVVGGAGAAAYYYNVAGFKAYVDTLRGVQSAASQEEKVIAAPVTTGDIVLRVSGVGNLLAGNEVKLGFGTSGRVKTVNVQPGNEVKVGTVLATLDDTNAKYDVVQAGVSLRQAQLQLTKLIDPTVDTIANAKATLASAQADLTKLTQPSTSQIAAAQSNLASAQEAYTVLVSAMDPNKQTSLQAALKSAEVTLAQAQSAYNKIAWRGDVGATTESTNLQNATIAYEKAKADYNLAAEGATADTVSAARAKISSAQDALNQLIHPDPNAVDAAKAKLAAAQVGLDNVQKGGNPQDVALAQLTVQTAQDNLHSKMIALASTVITSPITGTVTTADVTIGQQASNGSAITVDQFPQVRFWIDQTDLSKIAVGNAINVTFSSYDNLSFVGKIVRIDPALVTVNNSPTVQVWATIDPHQHPVTLLYGMDADVEVISGEARNAVLAPVQALRQLGPGQYAVFVVQPNGELEMRPIKVGLKDAVNAQILDGLKPGEQVSIGSSASGQGSSTRTGQNGANRTGAQNGANAGAGR